MTELAYLNGVYEGDGWCSHLACGLKCKDHDFALEFSRSIKNVFGIDKKPRVNTDGYWDVRLSNRTGKFNIIKEFKPVTLTDKSLWLKGFFDSEGSAVLFKLKRGKNSYIRQISFCNTDTDLIKQCSDYLSELGISFYIRELKKHPSRYGNKTVYHLMVRASKENFSKFNELVSTSIQRKKETIELMLDCYL